MKMDENTLQMSYDFTIDVIHDNTQSPYPAILGEKTFQHIEILVRYLYYYAFHLFSIRTHSN